MAAESARSEPAGLPRILRVLLEERSIQWMLLAGIAIVLGSTLGLVISAWAETGALAKLAVVAACAGAIHLAGAFAWRRAALRRTGVALEALALFLVPVTGLAAQQLGTLGSWPGTALTVAAAAISAMVARDALGLLLRSTPPAVAAALLVLAWAPPLLPAGPLAAQIAAGLGLAAVLLGGTIKANRHLFWLEEDGRAPRIFRLFPFVLLATTAIASLTYVLRLPAPWIGFFAVLIALALAQAADALLRVERLRRVPGDRRLPLRVAVPIAAALAAGVGGLFLAGGDLRALVPAAAVEAGTLVWLARRHGKPVLAYGAIASAAVAYQSSWVYYETIALALIDGAATLVREERLPLPFYGLTYLPFVLACLGLSEVLRRRGEALLASALLHAGAVLSGALAVVSLFDLKAAAATMPLFGGLALAGVRVYRTRALALPGLLCLGAAAIAIPGLALPSAQGIAIAGLALAYGLLGLVPRVRAFLGDRALLVAIILAAAAAIPFLEPRAGLLAATLAASGLALLCATALEDSRAIAEPGAGLLAFAAAILVAGWPINLGVWPTACVVAAASLAEWEIARRLRGIPTAIAPAFGRVATAVGWMILVGLWSTALLGTPSWAAVGAGAIAAAILRSGSPLGTTLAVEAAALAALRALVPGADLMTALALAAALRTGVLAAAGARLPPEVLSAAAAVSAAVAAAGIALHEPVSVAAALAGGVGVVVAGRTLGAGVRDVGWVIIALAAAVAVPAAGAGLAALTAVLAACAAAWALRALEWPERDGERAALVAAGFGMTALWTVILAHSGGRPDALEQVALALPFVAGAGIATLAARRLGSEAWAAGALFLAGALALDLAAWEVIRFGHGISKIAAIGSAIAFHLLARLAGRESARAWAPFELPLEGASRILAGASVALALGSFAMSTTAAGGAACALTLFLAAAYCGILALETRLGRWIVLATAAADAGAVVLFRAVGWTDPGFVLVPIGTSAILLAEALAGAMPGKSRAQLRMAGALAIVVAPMPAILAQGSWAHVFALLASSTALGIAGLGLRVRSLVWLASAFLAIDLVAMVTLAARRSPDILWAAGLALGAAVIAGAAKLEHRRR